LLYYLHMLKNLYKLSLHFDDFCLKNGFIIL